MTHGNILYPSSFNYKPWPKILSLKGYWAHTNIRVVHVGVVEVAIRIHKEHVCPIAIPTHCVKIRSIVIDIPCVYYIIFNFGFLKIL